MIWSTRRGSKKYFIPAFLISFILVFSSLKLRKYSTVVTYKGKPELHEDMSTKITHSKVPTTSQDVVYDVNDNGHCQSEEMKLRMIDNQEEEAVCLDGSKPGFYMRNGSERKKKKWIIYLQGSDWCINEDDCLGKPVSSSSTSSSKELSEHFSPDKARGILSPCKGKNPYFYDWNVVFIPSCDGGAFLGNREEPIVHSSGYPMVYLKGRLVVKGVIRHLMTQGLAMATDLLLVGCGASGFGALLNAETLQQIIPNVNVRVLMDGGFFMEAGDPGGDYIFKHLFEMNFVKEFELVEDCLASVNKTNRDTCFYTSNLLQFTRNNVFLLTPLYDPWHVNHQGFIKCSGSNCLLREHSASDSKLLQTIGEKAKRRIRKLSDQSNLVFYQTSCLSRCLTLSDDTWNVIRVNKTTPVEAVHKWIIDKETSTEYRDCNLPQCNDLCPTVAIS